MGVSTRLVRVSGVSKPALCDGQGTKPGEDQRIWETVCVVLKGSVRWGLREKVGQMEKSVGPPTRARASSTVIIFSFTIIISWILSSSLMVISLAT